MNAPKVLPNRNVEIVVQLLPEAYAALNATAERDGCSWADVINIAVVSHNTISAAMDAAGKNLGKATAEPASGAES